MCASPFYADAQVVGDMAYVWANVAVSGIFGGLQAFFGVHHINLVRANNTTIELIGTQRLKKSQQQAYDLGTRANMEQVGPGRLDVGGGAPHAWCTCMP